GDELLERALGVGDLAVEPRVAERDGEVLREHLQQLPRARIDGAAGGAVVNQQPAQRALGVADGARDDDAAGARNRWRRLRRDRHDVVAEAGVQLAGHGGGDRLVVELADDRARDLAQDRQLGDAQRLLDALTLRRFFQLARLGAEPAHLLDQPRDLPARTQLGLPAQQRAPHAVFQALARW